MEYRSIVDPAEPNYRSKLADDIQQTMREYNARPRPNGAAHPSQPLFKIEPFAFLDPKTIPRREWLYGRHLIRQYLSTTIAAGGVGKSSLALVEALAMASGRNLLGIQPRTQLRVYYWNGEDPLKETQTRVAAAMLYYGITEEDLGGRFFAASGRDHEIVVAVQERSEVRIAVPLVEAMIATLTSMKIDVVIIDPFISSHQCDENSNMAIDTIAKLWGKVSDRTNSAVELIHHSKKTGGAEVTVEDSRGASALVAASRSARTLNSMTKEEADRAGVGADKRKRYFRADNGKANLAPADEGATWFKMASQCLGNVCDGYADQGDEIGVATSWEWPDPLADIAVADVDAVQRKVRSGRWRESPQSPEWVGRAIAEVLGLDIEEPADRAKVKGLLRIWYGSKALIVRDLKDENSIVRKFVEAGK